MKKQIVAWLPEILRSRITGEPRSPLVSVVRLTGVIGGNAPLRAGLNLQGVSDALEAAFGMSGVRAVALLINSPGGSSVQSSLIFKLVRALATEKKLPVYAFAEDVAASGGYMLACAADEIYADESSIVGSIGVISASFGFTGLIEKLGVERRVHTSGESKSMLDPFQPEDPDDVARLSALQRDVHDNFKSLVRGSRGSRLKDVPEIFTGEFWAGRGALERGLIDGLGDFRSVLRSKFGEKLRLKHVGGRKGLLQRLPGFARQSGPDIVESLISAMEARSLWSRFGL
jgi:serine protease SohB